MGNLLRFIQALLVFVSTLVAADAAIIASGENRDGTIAVGASESWTFDATTGESILLRLAKKNAGENYTPNLKLLAPNGLVLAEQAHSNDASITLSAPQSGTYTAIVTGYYNGDTGSYRLRLLKFPSTLLVPSGDEGGALVSGQNHDGTIELGDLDAWTFQAAINDTLLFRVGKTSGNLSPHIRLYGPDGAFISEHSNWVDAGIPYRATKAGVHTVVISSYYSGDTGTYRLRGVKLPGTAVTPPGDEGGALVNGQNHDAVIDIGDIDTWTVNATAGETLLLRAGKLSGTLTPHLVLYAPDGSLIGENANNTDAALSHDVVQSGTFTVLVVSYYSGDTGSYRLRMLKGSGPYVIPAGDDGGLLTNGQNHDGQIDVGDLDPWTIAAAVNDTILVRAGRITAAGNRTLHLRLFAPDGKLVGEHAHDTDTGIQHRAIQAGNYTVIVSSYYSNDSGDYRLRLVKAPGQLIAPANDEGGILLNGQILDGSIPAGDMDAWTIAANSGSNVSISLTKQTGGAEFTPHLAVYDANGAVVAEHADGQSAAVNFAAPTSGLFTVVARGYYSGDNGTYRLAIAGVTAPLAPTVTLQPLSQTVAPVGNVTFNAAGSGSNPLKYQWRRNGVDIGGATGPILVVGNAQPGDSAVYSYVVSNDVGSAVSAGAVLGLQIQTRIAGSAIEFAANIAHANGNVYDQFLLNGPAATITADPGQIVRTSYVDLNDDIVQVEFSGAGSLTIALTGASGPGIATKYNQPAVQYMKGHATLTLVGANENTHLSVFTVGAITAVNQALFKPNETYDGVADIAFLAVSSPTNRLGSIRLANTEIFNATGFTGVYAPGVRIGGPANILNITAIASATPMLLTGTIDTGRIGITGGDMLQLNGRAIQVGDAQAVAMLAGANSHGVPLPAQTNRGQYERNGVNVTAQLIQNP